MTDCGSIFVSGAAVIAALGAWLGAGLALQFLIFAVVLAGSLLVLRPRMMKKLDAPGVPSRTQALTAHQRWHESRSREPPAPLPRPGLAPRALSMM